MRENKKKFLSFRVDETNCYDWNIAMVVRIWAYAIENGVIQHIQFNCILCGRHVFSVYVSCNRVFRVHDICTDLSCRIILYSVQL